MEISSHYYALLALCRTCGINKETSHKIAYASQFVDDAKINCLSGDDGFKIENIATCHSYSKIRTFNYEAMILNTVSFHFPPGCEGEHFADKLVCKENSEVINEIVKQSVDVGSESAEGKPEVFGMLMHIYADTFAHQGFSGLLSKVNDIEHLDDSGILIHQDGWKSVIPFWWGRMIRGLKKLKAEPDFDDFMPAYGHGQAGHCPDIPYLKWSYEYSHDRCEADVNSKVLHIDNIQRFKRAFESIQTYLEKYLERNPDFKDPDFNSIHKEKALIKFFEILKAKETTSSKIKSWQNFMVNNNFYNKSEDKEILEYDELLWIKELIYDYDESTDIHKDRKVSNVKLLEGYINSSWVNYVVGVKWYKQMLMDSCKPRGLDIDAKHY